VILTNIEMSTQQPIVSMKFLEYKWHKLMHRKSYRSYF
jgi:hypothetical protein